MGFLAKAVRYYKQKQCKSIAKAKAVWDFGRGVIEKWEFWDC